MKIIDTFLFFNEIELIKFRIELLFSYVDYFIVVEFDHTFSGKYKGYNFPINDSFYDKYRDKIIYIRANNDDIKKLRVDGRVTDFNVKYTHKHNGIYSASKLSKCFQNEIYQRDYIIVPLSNIASDDDIILINDLDEIPNPDLLSLAQSKLQENPHRHINFEQKWFLYSLFYKKPELWYGTRACTYKFLDNKSIDLMRYNLESREHQFGEIIENGGWHLSSFGLQSQIMEKMRAYDYQGKKIKIFYKFLDLIFPNRISRNINSSRNILDFGKKVQKTDYRNEFNKKIIDIINNHKILTIWQ